MWLDYLIPNLSSDVVIRLFNSQFIVCYLITGVITSKECLYPEYDVIGQRVHVYHATSNAHYDSAQHHTMQHHKDVLLIFHGVSVDKKLPLGKGNTPFPYMPTLNRRQCHVLFVADDSVKRRGVHCGGR